MDSDSRHGKSIRLKRTRQDDLGWDRVALAGEGGEPTRRRWVRWPWYVAPLAVAISLHALVLMAGYLWRLNDVGVINGDQEGISVEILDESMLNERYPPSTNEKVATAAQPPPSPQAPPPAPAVPPEPSPAPAARSPAIALPDDALGTLPMAVAATSPALDLSVPQSVMTAQQKQKPMTAAELVNRQLGGSARQRAGAKDDYDREVMRILDRSKPAWYGSRVRLIAELRIATTGDVENLTILQSSGSPDLDKLVLASLENLHFPIPPPGADAHDRTYDITYN